MGMQRTGTVNGAPWPWRSGHEHRMDKGLIQETLRQSCGLCCLLNGVSWGRRHIFGSSLFLFKKKLGLLLLLFIVRRITCLLARASPPSSKYLWGSAEGSLRGRGKTEEWGVIVQSIISKGPANRALRTGKRISAAVLQPAAGSPGEGEREKPEGGVVSREDLRPGTGEPVPH